MLLTLHYRLSNSLKSVGVEPLVEIRSILNSILTLRNDYSGPLLHQVGSIRSTVCLSSFAMRPCGELSASYRRSQHCACCRPFSELATTSASPIGGKLCLIPSISSQYVDYVAILRPGVMADQLCPGAAGSLDSALHFHGSSGSCCVCSLRLLSLLAFVIEESATPERVVVQ